MERPVGLRWMMVLRWSVVGVAVWGGAGCSSQGKSDTSGPTSREVVRDLKQVEQVSAAETLAMRDELAEMVRVMDRGLHGRTYLTSVASRRKEAWERAAAAGSAEGLVLVGLCRLQGVTGEANQVEGTTLIMAAARMGQPEAEWALASCYAERVIPEAPPGAAALYRSAAEKGSTLAMVALAVRAMTGEDASLGPAEQWLERAAARGSSSALYQMAQVRLNRGSPREAAGLARQAAERGNLRAMYDLGFLYLSGRYAPEIPENATEGASWLRRAAVAGYAPAMFEYGIMCLYGTPPVAQDDRAAVEWFRRGAAAGDANCMSSLGTRHQDGRGGVARDPAKAIEWYEASARAGNREGRQNVLAVLNDGTPAGQKRAVEYARRWSETGDATMMAAYGVMLLRGAGVEQDAATGERLVRRAAETGEMVPLTRLAEMMRVGRIKESRSGERLEVLERAVAAGSVMAKAQLAYELAQGDASRRDPARARALADGARRTADLDTLYLLATMELRGELPNPRPAEGVTLLERVAARDYAPAMTALAVAYADGTGVARDPARALDWYRKAADVGDEHGIREYALALATGRLGKTDAPEALRRILPLAEQGNIDACSLASLLLIQGNGVTKDPARSERFLRYAAEGGDTLAMNNLGWHLEQGHYGRVDAPEAVKWYGRGAEAGNDTASMNLARIYLKGAPGVPANQQEALRYLQLAARAGNADAQRVLKQAGMTW